MSNPNLIIECPSCKTKWDAEDDLPYDEGSSSQVSCECGAVLEIGFYRVTWVNLISAPEAQP